MGFKRSTRPAQVFRVVLLCDPAYQERRADSVKAAGDVAVRESGADVRSVRFAGEADAVGRIEASEALYRESLDVSCLIIDTTNVTGAYIRALTVDDSEAIRDEAMVAAIAQNREAAEARKAGREPATQDDMVRARSIREGATRTVLAGLVTMDGDGLAARGPGGLYPIESLRELGPAMIPVVDELAGYISRAGDLGE